MTIKVLEKTPGCMPMEIEKGEWIDLRLTEEVTLSAPYVASSYKRVGEKREYQRKILFDSTIARLGVCMQLPKGFEALIIPRSSTFKRYGIMESNSVGLIDNSYCSDNDEWRMPMVATRAITIPQGTRIAQFRIQLSQKATIWQKLRWLFSSGVKIKPVDSLQNPERGGFGSTGEN